LVLYLFRYYILENIFTFWVFRAKLRLQVPAKVVLRPDVLHVFFRVRGFAFLLFIFLFLEFFNQGIVSQMRKFARVICIIIFKSKSNVAFIINPNSKRIPVFNENPLPYIELSGLDDQRILDVLLYHPMSSFGILYVIQYLVMVGHYLYSSSSARHSWLYDPKVLFTADVVLRVIFFQFREDVLDVGYQRVCLYKFVILHGQDFIPWRFVNCI
jgi:hypothetical protein